MEIRLEGDTYIIIGGDERSLRVVPGGPVVEQETPEGERAQITATLREGALEIRIRTSRAERVQTITPTEEGLHVANTFTMGQLPQPVRMEIIYLREGTAGLGGHGSEFPPLHRFANAEVDR
jgi:hypothetical protein